MFIIWGFNGIFMKCLSRKKAPHMVFGVCGARACFGEGAENGKEEMAEIKEFHDSRAFRHFMLERTMIYDF